MTTREFRIMKAKYVAKHGYTITVPGLSDIIHLGLEDPMTDKEKDLWKKRRYDEIPEHRLAEIRAMKQKRKDKFLAMLASPTPHVINNLGSIMTSIDDAQDALGTLAYIGRVGMAIAPRLIGKALAGPVGWTMTAAEILNLVQHLGYKRLGSKKAKREKDAATKNNPKSKLQKVKDAMRLKKIWPSQGRIIEALQVSDNIFGVGVCLGPIVGFGIEAVTGPMRRITGARVEVKVPWPILSHFTMKAQRQARSQLAYIGAGLQTDDDEVMAMAFGNYLSRQELLTMASGWNAIDNVDDLGTVEIHAPIPENILTIEVLEEAGINIDDVVGWPHNDEKWLAIADIPKYYDTPCKQFHNDYMAIHNHDWIGFTFGGLCTEATSHTLASCEGEYQVVYDYTPGSKWAHIMLDNGLMLEPIQPKIAFARMEYEIIRLDRYREKPTMRNINSFCSKHRIKLRSFL